MNLKTLIPLGCAVLLAGLAGCEKNVSYAADIQPILNDSCLACHTLAGEGVAASGFAVDDYDATMKGTKFGTVVVPGSSMSSSLYLVVASKTDRRSTCHRIMTSRWHRAAGSYCRTTRSTQSRSGSTRER